MVDAVERMLNLALFFAGTCGEWVTAERIRTEVAGYPAGQDEAAFLRMFERDKDELRSFGLVISSTAEGTYRFDAASTFASEVALDADEATALRAVGIAMLDDPGFPFAEDLRFALAKIATSVLHGDVPVSARTAEERPEHQASAVSDLDDAVLARKIVEFDYTNSRGEHKHHAIEPHGLFPRDGRWYVVGRDRELGEQRVYAVSRVESLSVAPKPKTPDFEREEGFDLASYIQLPFQFSAAAPFEAVLEFDPSDAWRAAAVTGGAGRLEHRVDGGAVWRVEARDADRLARWVVENGPGLRVVSPPQVHDALSVGLRAASQRHAGGVNGSR